MWSAWLYYLGVSVLTVSSGRQLLSEDAPQTYTIYCYPSGTCNLPLLSASFDGFVITSLETVNSIANLDINGDGLPDIVIGCPTSNYNGPPYATGRIYVVFGTENRTGEMDLFELMDGVRGFTIDGDISNRQMGFSVSDAGDVNADGTNDLIIGATCYYSDIACISGRSYVIYGNPLPGAWGNGTFRIQYFSDGERGFALLSDQPWGRFGTYSGSAGDVNGDNVDDYVIGAGGSVSYNTSLQIYVIFGSRNNSDGFRNVSTLTDGKRGFVYQTNLISALSVFGAGSTGDIDGDGINDLMIADATMERRSLVVFGSRDANFWGSGIWNEAVVNNSFVATNNTWRGFFTPIARRTQPIVGDLNGDGVEDLVVVDFYTILVIFGSKNTSYWPYSTYWDSVPYVDGIRGFQITAQYDLDCRVVDFNDDGVDDLVFSSPRAPASPTNMTAVGGLVVLFGTRDPLAWVIRGGGFWNPGDFFNLLDGVRGFSLQGNGGLQQVFKPLAADFNGDTTPDFLIQVGFGDFYGVYGASYSSFTFKKNSLYLTMGQTVRLTLNNIDVNCTHNALNLNDTFFIVANLSHGIFTFVNTPLVPLSNFSRKNISDSLIQFVHNGDSIAPTYRLTAVHSNLLLRAIYSIANVEFYVDPSPPILERNQAIVEQGKPQILSSGDLLASDPDGTNGTLVFLVRGVQHARFNRLAPNGTVAVADVSQFEQQAIFDRLIQLVPDGGSLAPAYKVAVFDGNSTTPDRSATIQFLYAPVLSSGSILLNPAEANYLTSQDLNASDVETPSSELIFEISNISQGYFLLSFANGTNASITNFSQNLLMTNRIIFVCPAFGNVSFFVRVFDGRLFSPWQSPSIRLNHPPILQFSLQDISIEKDRMFDATVGPVNIFRDPDGDSLSYSSRLASGLDLPAEVTFQAPNRFRGVLLGVVELTVIITAMDSRGLTASGVFKLGNLNSRPSLIMHPMIVDEGQHTIIGYQSLQAVDLETLAEDLVIEVNEVRGGRFIFAGAPDGNVTAFRQLVLILGTVQFLQEGDDEPQFSFRAFDGRLGSDWEAANLTLNRNPRVKQQFLPLGDHEATQGEEFQFWLPSSLFEDPDGDILDVTAQLQRGLSLPKEIQFTAPNSFRGMMSTTGSFLIVVEARDPRQLAASATFSLAIRSPPVTADLKTLVTSFSSLGGVGLSIAAFLWFRRRIALHRRDFQFANALRFTLNLEYYDFTRFLGDTYKTRVNDFLNRLQLEHREFFSQLNFEERNNFAVCVAEILTKRGLVSRSDSFSGLFGLLCFLNVGWPCQLDLQQFEAQSISIATEAINAWSSQSDPVEHWPYQTFNCKEQLRVLCCCARPIHENRWFIPDQGGVALTTLRKREAEHVPSQTRMAVLEEQARQMAITIKILSDRLEIAESKALAA